MADPFVCLPFFCERDDSSRLLRKKKECGSELCDPSMFGRDRSASMLRNQCPKLMVDESRMRAMMWGGGNVSFQ